MTVFETDLDDDFVNNIEGDDLQDNVHEQDDDFQEEGNIPAKEQKHHDTDDEDVEDVDASNDEVYNFVLERAKAAGLSLPDYGNKEWQVEEVTDYFLGQLAQRASYDGINDEVLKQLDVDVETYRESVQEFDLINSLKQEDPVKAYARIRAVEEFNADYDDDDDEDPEKVFKSLFDKYVKFAKDKLSNNPNFQKKIDDKINDVKDPRALVIDAVNKKRAENIALEMASSKETANRDAIETTNFALRGIGHPNNEKMSNNLYKDLINERNAPLVEKSIHDSYEVIQDGEAVTIAFFKQLMDSPTFVSECIWLHALYKNGVFRNLKARAKDQAVNDLTKKPAFNNKKGASKSTNNYQE